MPDNINDIKSQAGLTNLIWDTSKGPFENALRVAGLGSMIGGMFGIGGAFPLILGASKMLGLDIEGFGKMLDNKLNLNHPNDISNIDPNDFGEKAADILWPQIEAAGENEQSTQHKTSALIRVAADKDPTDDFENELRKLKENPDYEGEVPEPVIMDEQKNSKKRKVKLPTDMTEGDKNRALKKELHKDKKEEAMRIREENKSREDALNKIKYDFEIKKLEQEREERARKYELDRQKSLHEQELDREKFQKSREAEDMKRYYSVEDQRRAEELKRKDVEDQRRHTINEDERKRQMAIEEDTRRRGLTLEEQKKLREQKLSDEKRQLKMTEEAQKKAHKRALQLQSVKGRPSLNFFTKWGGRTALAAALGSLAVWAASKINSPEENAATRKSEESVLVRPRQEGRYTTDRATTDAQSKLNNVINEIMGQ